jgi:fumarate reductase flavoprotein subunit
MSSVQRDVDVLVIGSGAAGLCAALAAADEGASRILVAEAEGVVGGSSRLSGGLVMGAGTRYQRAVGIEDSGAELYADYLAVNRWNVDPGIVRALCDHCGRIVDWLGDLGVEFHHELVKASDERTPRVHVPKGRGQAIVDTLHRHCREREIDVALGQRVDRLLTEGRSVTGVAVGRDEITAGAVVVATGGFGNAPDKLAAHYPSAAATERAWYIGADGARGDAIELAGQVDAQLVGHDHGLRLLDVGFDRELEAFLPGWLVMVNRQGHRFVDETAPYGVVDTLVRAQGDRVWVIFDQAALDAVPTWGADQFLYTVPGHRQTQSRHWNPDLVAMMQAAGLVRTAGSLHELADALGVDATGLAGSIERYNESCRAGHDEQCCKSPRFLHPVAVPPFYGAELRPATVCSTAYGLRIDATTRVLGVDDRPIPGLFAAGECTGHVVGPSYFGSGNNYANCVTIGHLAGEAAARHAAS